MNARIETALNNPNSGYIARFTTLSNALSYRNTRQNYTSTPILLGDDGKFWLAPNNKVAYKLIDMGYEVA